MRPEQRLDILKILRSFFRVASPLFFFSSFVFTVDSSGTPWIMWRDATLLAATFAALGLIWAAGWLISTLRLQRLSSGGEEISARDRVDPAHPYNIWGPMALRSRLGLAAAVFLIFGTIGPLATLMGGPSEPIRPLGVLIVTIASGGISASIVLFGNRLIVLAISLALCIAASNHSGEIADWLVNAPTPQLSDGTSLTLTSAQLDNMRDERMLVGVAGMSLIACGYVVFLILLSVEGRQRVRLQAEVTIARQIQQSLFPPSGLPMPHCRVAGKTVTTTEVGGDYFDYLETPDGHLAVLAADVAGHGVGAGILGAMTKSAFRSQVMHDPSPVPMLRSLNNTLTQLVERKMFVTAAYLLIDPEGTSARAATAGHPAMLRMTSDGSIEEIRTPSLALGMKKDAPYSEQVLALATGDTLVLLTDGVVEAAREGGDQFGYDRVKMFLREHRGDPPEKVCEQLLETVFAYVGEKSLHDDATVVAVSVRDDE